MQNFYERDLTILPSMCDATAKLGIPNAFALFMDLATEHAEILGVGMNGLMKQGLFWLTVRTRIRFSDRPAMTEKVRLRTWPEAPERSRCNRDYAILRGDEIIVSGLEHHSNIVPWQMLCERKKAVLRHIPLRPDLSLDIEAFKGLLSDKTKLVSVAHVSNVLGTIQPVEEIIRLAHARKIPVCIDGAQSVPHMRVDVQALDCDFLVFSGHKMYAPTGIGVLYGKREWLEQIPPHEGGGEMIEHVRWSGTTYNTLPYKFEAGTPNFVGSYALHKAIEYIEAIGWEAIEAHERELTEYCEKELIGVGCKVYGVGQKKAGVISFNLVESQKSKEKSQLIHPFDVGTLLDQQGVAVRTGHHCAQPLIDTIGVPGTVRVSFGLYNEKADVDAFITALKRTQSMLL